MNKKSFADLVRAVTFPICVLSCFGFVVCGLFGIWFGIEDSYAMFSALTGSFFITAFGSAMALGAAAAMKNSQ